MSFASADFLAFFAAVLAVTWIIQKFLNNRAREVFLLLVSYFFYGYWDWRFCFLLLLVSASSYFTAMHAEKKPVYICGIVVPLVVLGFFKYFNFFVDTFAALIGSPLGTLSIILPVGISFYTFQALSYVIDVKRKKIEPERDFVRLALYLSFFPQLVAGPIVRAVDFLPQLYENRKVNAENLKLGIQLMVFGLFKKIVLSDHISVFVDDVFAAPETFSWLSIAFGVMTYSLQIYLDFSGYPDIATGCAKCLGYDFNRNFNLPYISADVTEFWRRWHVSLSTWLKEYLYIPLGGNRKGKTRQYFNLMVTMLLGGLWHGASWTFVFWGALNGLALCIDKLIPQRLKPEKGPLYFLRIIGTFLFESFCWIFFRSDSFYHAWRIIRGIFSFKPGVAQPFSWAILTFAIVITATVCAVVRARKNGEKTVNGYYPVLDLSKTLQLALFFIALGLLAGLAYTGNKPFVYFQF